jgi:hypothetical protein
MSYLNFLKRNKMADEVRWVVKYNSYDKIREIKQIFNPNEYNRRKLLTQDQLIKVIEVNNAKSNTNIRTTN